MANGTKPLYIASRKRWRILYTDNKGKRKPVYGKTEKEVIEKHLEIRMALKRGKYIEKSKDTIREIMEDMLEKQKKKKKKGKMKANSYGRKLDTKNMILKYMKDICDKPIQRVTIEQIEDGFTKLEELKKPNGEYKYAQSTLNKAFSLLREVYTQAVQDKKISTEDNPFKTEKGVEKPVSNKDKKDIKVFNKKESTAFFKELDKGYDEYTDVFYFLAYSSTRPGEAVALCTKHIDLEEEKIHIEDNQSRDENSKIIIGSTKTESRR